LETASAALIFPLEGITLRQAVQMRAYTYGISKLIFRKANFEPFDETAIMKKQGHMMGVIDVKFNKQATKVAVSSLDSVIRVWDIATSTIKVMKAISQSKLNVSLYKTGS
jgi:WD40 repeat protein